MLFLYDQYGRVVTNILDSEVTNALEKTIPNGYSWSFQDETDIRLTALEPEISERVWLKAWMKAPETRVTFKVWQRVCECI